MKVICLFDTTRVTVNNRDVIAMKMVHQMRNRRTNRLKRKSNRLKRKRGGDNTTYSKTNAKDWK